MKLRSITTKFILIVSVLMAMIMALQYYFITETQKDALTEINRISQTINKTTDRIFLETIQEPDLVAPPDPDLFEVPELKTSVKPKQKIIHDQHTWVTSVFSTKDNSDARIDTLLKKHLKDNVSWVQKENNEPVIVADPSYQYQAFTKGSDDNSYEVVEININKGQSGARRKAGVTVLSDSTAAKDVVSFVFPNFAAPKMPQMVRLNYNTSDFSNALDDMRNRNILITLSLFGVSLLIIAVIAGKFLRPIKSLNQSFDKVVQGDLSVTVKQSSNDEIGELSASFNHMVNELRKNKDKEAIMNRQERLASLGQLAAGVAHEIKNPLNAINLTIEHLSDKFVPEKESQAAQYIATIQKEIRRLDKTVNNFLSYLRSEKLEKQDCDINIILDEIFNLYEREIVANKINLVKEYQDNCIKNIDPERFKTVLMNIVINAIQAMPNGGKLKVVSSREGLQISDSGVGIPERNLEHIFDLFYTTKSAGSGLGLPTAYKIVKEHGGDILIESSEGGGTTVKITV
ncbi:MAG: HAMP domain-containing protein [Calditrichae bacterium]|nr:HAMP domain-containing protein [Calditrichia bacterium]